MLLICFLILSALLCFVVTTEDADVGTARASKGAVEKNDNR